MLIHILLPIFIYLPMYHILLAFMELSVLVLLSC
uniref:Uncharacterized protein n=1 Tax=Anguilla anguilla TaxID=7936 RepID=A0A0E9T1Z4_ANGAN